MFSLVKVSLLSFNLGPKVTAIGQLGWGGGQVTKDQVEELKVPWQSLLPNKSLFSLLSWHTRVSQFAGRDDQINELREWAESSQPVWVKFVVGEGGVGKSRLGAEFSEAMQQNDWAAGFVDLRKPHAFSMKQVGTLLVVDYLEEHISQVTELLKDLSHVGAEQRLRVLFLTRRPPDSWENIISSANARNIVDTQYMTLGRLDLPSAKVVYDTTTSRAGEVLQEVSASGLGPAPIPEDAMAAWLKLAPENERALFVMAAAVHSAENPDRETVDYSGREIVKTLVKREVDRCQRTAEDRGIKDRFALARLLAMAAIADELTVADIRAIIEKASVPLGFKQDDDIEGELMPTGLLVDGRVRSPRPDIVAAAFVVDVFGRRPEYAAEAVWAALEKEISGGLDRIGRLCYDTEIVLGIHEPRLSYWLAAAVEGNIQRCILLQGYVTGANLPLGWIKTAVAVWRTLLDHAEDDEDRALILNNLSNILSVDGDNDGALATIQESVGIRRRLARANPVRYEPDLAMNLNNLSNRLSDTGDNDGALAAIQEAEGIYRRLADGNPARYEPDLAMSLNNLSIHLRETGDNNGALAAIQESVGIRRRLVRANPVRYEPDLARNLNNLSNRLSDTGDNDGALTAIQEAEGIYRRLADGNPARYEPDLAMSLNNLSIHLRETGDNHGALVATKESVGIRRRLVRANPARHEPVLVTSLGNMGATLLAMQKRSEAAAVFGEAVALIRPYAEKWPGSRHEELLKNLQSDLKRASGDSDS